MTAIERRCARGHLLTVDTVHVAHRAGRTVLSCQVCDDARNGVTRLPRRPVPVAGPVGLTARVRKVGDRWCVALLADGQPTGPVCHHRDWERAMLCATTWTSRSSRVRVRRAA